jgi:hypothetical protein
MNEKKIGLAQTSELIDEIFEAYVFKIMYDIYERKSAICAVAKIKEDDLMNLLLKKTGQHLPASIKNAKNKIKTKERISSYCYFDTDKKVLEWVAGLFTDKDDV